MASVNYPTLRYMPPTREHGHTPTGWPCGCRTSAAFFVGDCTIERYPTHTTGAVQSHGRSVTTQRGSTTALHRLGTSTHPFAGSRYELSHVKAQVTAVTISLYMQIVAKGGGAHMGGLSMVVLEGVLRNLPLQRCMSRLQPPYTS
uniref:Uncharacterized protein n=1 Tax=Eutreptiella gymnastica TaxID=73025 RepID=A0A7S4GHT4_9EUGL